MSLILSGDTGVPVTTVTGTLPVANGGTGVTTAIDYGFRNRIINGSMVIDQRNAGASVTPTSVVTGTYTLDRWQSYGSQASKYSVQQNAGSVTPPVGFVNYLGITSLSAYTVGSGETFNLRQIIEGYNIADLGFGTANAKSITVSFWVRSSLTGTFSGYICNAAGDRSYVFSYTINAANTWEQKTATIAGDTSGTWLTTNGAGVYLGLNFGQGASAQGAAGVWTAGSYFAVTGQTSVVGTSGATFYITGVQLEKGSTATSFDYRPYGTELALCQRYYQQIVGNTSGAYVGSVLDVAKQLAFGQCAFKVTMRTSPTVVLYDANGVSGTVTQVGTADAIPATAGGINVNGFTQISKTTSTFTSTYGYPVVAGFTASAEL